MKLSGLGKIVTPALIVGALLLTVPATAFAQGYPSQGQGYGNGNYGTQGYGNRGRGGYYGARADVSGIVTYYNRFDLRVRIGGRDQYVRLHQGTIINPTGISLRPGMRVNVAGMRERNGTLDANRIDVQRRGGRRY